MNVGVDMIATLCDLYRISPDWILMSRGNNMFRETYKMPKIWVDDEPSDLDTTLPSTKEGTSNTPQLSDDPDIGKPYYDVDFMGGFTEVFNSQKAYQIQTLSSEDSRKPICGVMLQAIRWSQKSTMATSLPFANVRWMMSSMAKYTLLCLTRYEPSRYCASLMILTSSVSSQSTCKISMSKNTPNQGYWISLRSLVASASSFNLIVTPPLVLQVGCHPLFIASKALYII